jgi:hypothetical protein
MDGSTFRQNCQVLSGWAVRLQVKTAEIYSVPIIAFDLDVAQACKLQRKGAGAGEGAEQGEDAQQPDPVFINDPGGDDAQRDEYADPFGRLVGVAFLCLGHGPIIAQGVRFFNYPEPASSLTV